MQRTGKALDALRNYQRLADESKALYAEMNEDRVATLADTVQASLSEHPFVKRTVKIEGREDAAAWETGVRNDFRRARIKEIETLRRKCEEFVSDVKDPVLRAALRLHYIKGLSWSETARRVYGSKDRADTLRIMVRRRLQGAKI